MTSSRGWMTPGYPGQPRRLTRAQKEMVRMSIDAALDNLWSVVAADLDAKHEAQLAESRRVALYALEQYPEDRSCHTCDYLHGQTCLHWKGEVPDDEALEEGCEHHQTDGAPF